MKKQKHILLRYALCMALCMVFVFFSSLSLFAQNFYDETRAVPLWFDEARYQIHNRLWIVFNRDVLPDGSVRMDPNFDEKRDNFYEAAEYISEIGVKAHTRHVKSGSEGAIWESSVGDIHPIVSQKGNIAQKLIDLSHDQGLRFIAYYRHFEDSWFVNQYPDTRVRDRDGEPLSKRGPWVSFATDYPQFLTTRLLELIEMGADGFYFDEVHIPYHRGFHGSDGDYSDPSKELFQERYGKDMLKAFPYEIENFRQEVMAETFLSIKNELVAEKPDIVLLLSVNGVRLKLLNHFYAKWEPHFVNYLGVSLPIVATIFRDASGGRPTHSWIAPHDKDQSLAEVARYLTYNTIYNRDIPESELEETSQWKINKQYKEQIELANKFSPHIAGKRPFNFAFIYIDENYAVWRDGQLSERFVNAFNLFREQMVSVGTITASQIKQGIPSESRVIVFPEKLYKSQMPERIREAIDKFESDGGVVLLQRDVTPSRIQDLCQQHSGVHISGDVDDMDVAMYKSSDHELLIALSNGPQQNISIQFDDRFIPENVFEVISGEPLTVDKNDNGFTVHLEEFEAMAGIKVDMKED